VGWGGFSVKIDGSLAKANLRGLHDNQLQLEREVKDILDHLGENLDITFNAGFDASTDSAT